MAVKQAIFGSFGAGKETIFGTGVTPDVYLPIRSESIADDNQFIERTGIRQTASEIFPVVGRFSAAGDFVLEPDGENCGLLLKALMGSETGTGLSTAYRHTFKFAQTPPSLSITADRVAVAHRYVGSVLTSCRFSMANNDLLLMTFSAQSKNNGEVTAPVPTYTDITPFAFPQATVTFDGTANTVVETIDLNINNNSYTDNWTLGSGRTRRDIPNQRRTVDGRLSLLFEDFTEYRRFFGTTSSTSPQTSLTSYELKVVFDSGVAIGASGYNYLIRFVMPKTIYSRSQATLTSGQIIRQEITFRSFETSTGANDAARLELENSSSALY